MYLQLLAGCTSIEIYLAVANWDGHPASSPHTKNMSRFNEFFSVLGIANGKPFPKGFLPSGGWSQLCTLKTGWIRKWQETARTLPFPSRCCLKNPSKTRNPPFLTTSISGLHNGIISLHCLHPAHRQLGSVAASLCWSSWRSGCAHATTPISFKCFHDFGTICHFCGYLEDLRSKYIYSICKYLYIYILVYMYIYIIYRNLIRRSFKDTTHFALWDFVRSRVLRDRVQRFHRGSRLRSLRRETPCIPVPNWAYDPSKTGDTHWYSIYTSYIYNNSISHVSYIHINICWYMSISL